jgi:antitoxin component YwqK of YwqJK toxin-antitoxin module
LTVPERGSIWLGVRTTLLLLALPLAVASAAGCRRDPKPERVAEGYLFEKGPYQGFYDGAGKLTRLLYDQNGDKKADVVMLFYPNGRPRQVEADTDFDGKIDRWQYYSENGVPEKEGYSRRGGAQPDTWQYFDVKGNLTRREIDEDGDGKIDRIETFQNGRVVAVGIDSDGDGKIERWQTWVGGRVVSEELDTDGDGISDRRLRYGANGHLAGMDILNARSTKVAAPAPAIAR